MTVDILVLGATGFTGRLVIRRLYSHPERSSFTFAIGARSKAKGEELKRSLAIDDSVPVVEVNLSNYEEIEAAVKDAKVVLNAAGPFWVLGPDVVRACAAHGKRYVDLTGEPHFVRRIIDQYDVLATKTGAIIVPASGFDSIPADILVHLSNRTLKNAFGPQAQLGLSQTFYDVEGGVSGGSLATLLTAIEQVPPAVHAEAASDYALSRVLGHPSPSSALAERIPFDTRTKYGGFWIMATMNRSIVQRSFGLNEFASSFPRALYGADRASAEQVAARQAAYGPQFRYAEYRVVGSWLQTVWFSLVTQWSIALMSLFTPLRWFVKTFGTKPGQGPSEKEMTEGKMLVTNYTQSATSPGVVVKSVMRGDADPGYLLTSYMVVECALALVLDDAALPPLARVGGILTPATALGDVLVKRLEKTGRIWFESEVVRDEADEQKKER